MTDQGEPRPRRALPPRDDVVAEAEDQPRTWEPASEGVPGASSGTPIPPPAVLPGSMAVPASAGRRFSAVELPDEEERPLPRRSALTPTRPESPPAVAADEADEAVETEAAPGDTGKRRVWPWVAVGAVVVAGGIAAATLLGGGGLPGSTPTPTIDPASTYLLQDADLTGLAEGVTWVSASTDTAVTQDTPQAKCFLSSLDSTPSPSSTLVRTFAPSAGQAGGLLHQVDAYATVEDATAAYAARVAELAGCSKNTALLIDTIEVTGLGDESAATKIVLQDTADEYHSLLLSRTGPRINIVDQTSPEQDAEIGQLATTLALAAQRQCTTEGTCPGTPTSGPTEPLPLEPPGWLAAVDLPRLTQGAGTWRGTDMSEMRLAGSRCEAVDLVNMSGVTKASQRTYLLGDDAAVPRAFGVDEAIYTYASADEANAAKDTLVGNIDGCPARTPTATVSRVGDLGESGASWNVSQQTDQTATRAQFRVTVQAVGNTVVYLMANPSQDTDFTDDQWLAISARAAARATELG